MSWKSSTISGSTPTGVTKLAADRGTPVSPEFIPIITVSLDEDEISEITAILRSGSLREGPVCRQFEETFAAHVGARYAVSVSSGTAALHIAYMALLEPGDEVLVPSFTFIATASMVAIVGAQPVFCDVDPQFFTLDVEDARRRVTERTKAIAPVHLFGNPCDIEAIKSLAAEYDLKIIWDAAQSHGAQYQGQDVGSFDDTVCYSFYPSKNMTTGEGGMITTNDEALYQKMKLLRGHGQSGKYYHTLLGFNYRLTDVMASLGLKQLAKLDGWIEQRRSNAHYLTEHLVQIPGIQPPVEQPAGKSSFNLYSILLDLKQFRCDRDEFIRLLRAENIGATVNYPRSLHQQPVFTEMGETPSLPVSESLSRQILSLPAHPKLGKEQLDLVINAVSKVAEATRD